MLLLEQTKGDAQKIALAISELWEDHRGNSTQDEWAIVEKKGKKKVVRALSLLLLAIFADVDARLDA